MSALKFSQIQDMLISLSVRMNKVEIATKANGVAVEDALTKIEGLQNEVSEIEEREKEKDSTYAGKWKNGETENDGEIVLMEVNTDSPTNEEGGDQPVVGETTYTFKINKQIPKITLAGDTVSGDYEFTPTDQIPFEGDESKFVYPDGVKATYTKGETTSEFTYTFAYTPANEAGTFGKITLTAPTSITFEANGEITFADTPIVIEGIPKNTSE